jgi:hypothetical protein
LVPFLQHEEQVSQQWFFNDILSFGIQS